MTTTKIFGNKIKDLRNKFDFTQSDIEHFSGVNVNIIRQIETGRSGTSKENMLAIANALKVPIEEIYINDYKNTVVLTVINSKGDCGKTSIVQNLSYELSLLKDKCVLIIDSDLQCSLTKSFSMNFNIKNSIYNALMLSDDFENPSNIENYIRELPTTYAYRLRCGGF